MQSQKKKKNVAFEKHRLHTRSLGLRISCKACLLFFLNIFSGDLYFVALNIEFFQVCLVLSQREKMNNLAKIFGTRDRRKLLRCLVIVVISNLWDVEKQRGVGEVLRSSF